MGTTGVVASGPSAGIAAAAQQQQPHAVLFPYPAQGHINPMMHLARKLLADGFFITFINTDYNHRRMFSSASADNNNNNDKLLLDTPNLRFLHLPDGLPERHGRFNENVIEITAAILALPGPLAKLIKRSSLLRQQEGSADHHHHPAAPQPPPITCIIADSFCSWVQDVADQLGVPRVALWTTPAYANLAYHFQSLLIDHGYAPLTDPSKASEVVTCIPGIAPMQLRDHISFFQVDKSTDFLFQWHLRLCMRRADEAAWNLGNTWEELDAGAAAAFTAEVPSYSPIGPLLPDGIFLSGTASKEEGLGAAAAPSLWEEDSGCLEWLSAHGEGTVLYISFGSIAHMAAEELEALVGGIRDSGVPFLWALRPDQGSIKVVDGLRAELSGSSSSSSSSPELDGRLVAWAPQLAVLAHCAVGGFLTHCGWNSVLESIAAGVPMLARAGGFAEQRMNAHYIADVWKAGLRIHEGAARADVARLVRALLTAGGARDEARRRVDALRRSAAAAAASADGSSARNYARFVDDMRRRAAESHLSLVADRGQQQQQQQQQQL